APKLVPGAGGGVWLARLGAIFCCARFCQLAQPARPTMQKLRSNRPQREFIKKRLQSSSKQREILNQTCYSPVNTITVDIRWIAPKPNISLTNWKGKGLYICLVMW